MPISEERREQIRSATVSVTLVLITPFVWADRAYRRAYRKAAELWSQTGRDPLISAERRDSFNSGAVSVTLFLLKPVLWVDKASKKAYQKAVDFWKRVR